MNVDDLIQNYRKVKSIGDICKDLNILQTNILSGKASKTKKNIVAKQICIEIMKMYGIVKLYKGDDDE